MRPRTIYDLFFDEERLEAFRRGLPHYRRYETFREYDIVKMQFLFFLLEREPEVIEVKPSADLYHFLPGQTFYFFRCDREAALSDERINLSRPLLGIKGTKYPIVDGLHRLYKAAHTGIYTLHCCFLYLEEAELCKR
jgi:hypothetical protein